MIALAALLAGCASTRVIALENELLARQLQQARAEALAMGEGQGPAPRPDLERLREWFQRAGLTQAEIHPPGLLLCPFDGATGRYLVAAQIFEDKDVLYLSVKDWMRLEMATSTGAMVLLLTQLATLNYDLLLGKLQLNPETGEISLSLELSLEEGLSYPRLERALAHMLDTAERLRPVLLRAAATESL